MKAIVLSCDKYHPFADHMITKYQKIWPTNEFIFRIPYNSLFPYNLKNKYGEKVELIKTPQNIKSTILTLIQDLKDETWIYWSIDDKYPIDININRNEHIVNLIKKNNKKLNSIDGISLSKFSDLNSQYKYIFIKNNPYIFRKSWAFIWLHQFLKVKVIRYLFNNYPDENFVAKCMDTYNENIILPYKLTYSINNYIAFGESTSRGKITKNCYESLIKNSIYVPSNFNITDKKIFRRPIVVKRRSIILKKYIKFILGISKFRVFMFLTTGRLTGGRKTFISVSFLMKEESGLKRGRRNRLT